MPLCSCLVSFKFDFMWIIAAHLLKIHSISLISFMFESDTFTNLCFIFSLRPINLHQLSPQKNAEICPCLVLGRFWPWLPRKSSNLFSLLLSKPSKIFTSFLYNSLHLSTQEEALLSTQQFHLPLPSPFPFPQPTSQSSHSLFRLQRGLLSL